MQLFKNDPNFDQKFFNIGEGVIGPDSAQRDIFFEEAYESFVLGELLYDNSLAPLANAIDRNIFRSSFFTIFDSFLNVGSFESYLTVFRHIFGDDVDVEFTVPAPGKLLIDIHAAGTESSRFVARRVVDNAYVFDPVVTQDGDQIMFRKIKGFQSQYELEQMLFEMVPQGIYTEITLTIGEEE